MKKEIHMVQDSNGDDAMYSIYCKRTGRLIWQGYNNLPIDIVFQCFYYVKESEQEQEKA